MSKIEINNHQLQIDEKELIDDENALNVFKKEFLEKMKKENEKIEKISTKSRWDYLYNQSKIKKEKAEKLRKQNEIKKNNLLSSECTFSPKLYHNKRYIKLKKNTTNISKETDDNNNYKNTIATRHKYWLQNNNRKIEKEQQIKEETEIKECFFYPELVLYIII